MHGYQHSHGQSLTDMSRESRKDPTSFRLFQRQWSCIRYVQAILRAHWMHAVPFSPYLHSTARCAPSTNHPLRKRELHWRSVSVQEILWAKVAPPSPFLSEALQPVALWKSWAQSHRSVKTFDVEGSEYYILEGVIDSGMMCNVIQHTITHDIEGITSAPMMLEINPIPVPHLNVFTRLL